MISLFVRALVSAFKARRELALKNVALRQQFAVLPRPGSCTFGLQGIWRNHYNQIWLGGC